MIRYRSLRMAPGANRPWLIESDDDSHPLDGWRRASCGVRNSEPAGATTVTCSVPDTVMSACAGLPQEEQNRAVSGVSVPQPGQRTPRF